MKNTPINKRNSIDVDTATQEFKRMDIQTQLNKRQIFSEYSNIPTTRPKKENNNCNHYSYADGK